MNLKNNKAITLIALVITIVVLLILAAIALNLILGDNGIIKKAKDAAIMEKKAQYIEEIQMEIVDESLERLQNPKEELFIVSLQRRLQGEQTASQENVKAHTKREWISKAEINLRTLLVVYTVDDYQILIDVDNENNTATIREGSFIKKGRECTITFDGNSAEGGSTASKKTSEGLCIELPESGFTKTNYTFVGWYKNPECDGDRYNPSEAYQVSNDETLYAKWSRNPITITYNPGFETEDTMSNTTIEVGAIDNLLDNEFSRLGYTFTGWKDQYDDTYIYENHQEITAEKDLILTAQWTLTNYTIEYNLGEGVANNPATYTIETPTFTLTNPTSSNEIFLGWSGTGLTGSDNKTVTIVQGSSGNRSYEANWVEKHSTTISYKKEVQTFVAPTTTTYILEVWGAQGGSSRGGKGGYATGSIELTEGQTLYIVTGGQGTNNYSSNAGGYNGGGAGGNAYSSAAAGSSGGGATHIAINQNLGELKNYKESKNNILIVAGGGGRSLRWRKLECIIWYKWCWRR